MLGTQGWQKVLDEKNPPDGQEELSENPMDAIDRLEELFKVLLEGANADVEGICHEFEVMLSCAGQFISLSTLDYQIVWWRLFHSPNSSECSNVVMLATLLFSLPVSNDKLECAFS